jgi:hypothetical protein
MQLQALEKAKFNLFVKTHIHTLKYIYETLFHKYKNNITLNEFINFAYQNSTINVREYQQQIY